MLLLLCFISSLLQAQEEEKGCPEFESAYAKADKCYEDGQYLESTKWYLAAVEAEEKSPKPNPKAIAKSLGNAGYSFDLANMPEKSVECYAKGLAIARKSNDSTEMSIGLANIAQSEFHRGRYEVALRFMKEALEIEKRLKNDEGISINLNSIGKIFESWNRPYDAINFYNQALEIDLKNNALPRIAIRYSGLGSVYKTLKNYPKALQYQKQALEIERKLGKQSKIAVRLDRIGEIYLETGDLALADKNFIESLTIFRADSNETSIANVLLHLGKSKLRQRKYEQSMQAFTECLDLAGKLNLSQVKMRAYQDLSVLMRERNEPAKALAYLQKYIILKDSVFTAESQSQIMEFREKFETEKKEKEIAILTAESEINSLQLKKNRLQKGFLIGSAILLTLIILLIFSRYRIKQKHNLLLEEKNNELKLLNDTKDRFFAIIAHDMKNPVSAFRNISGSLMRNFENMKAEELKYYISELNQTAGNVKDLLQNLLEWARSQLNNISIHKENHDLTAIAEDAIHAIENGAKEKNIRISLLFEQGSTVYTDANILTTVMRNLLSNAVKFTPANGMIEIGFQQDTKQAQVWIRDTGSGMSEADVARLFRIDVDVRTISPHPEKGSGLGLILCHELITKTGGEIKVESSVGIGSKFIINLPVQIAD